MHQRLPHFAYLCIKDCCHMLPICVSRYLTLLQVLSSIRSSSGHSALMIQHRSNCNYFLLADQEYVTSLACGCIWYITHLINLLSVTKYISQESHCDFLEVSYQYQICCKILRNQLYWGIKNRTDYGPSWENTQNSGNNELLPSSQNCDFTNLFHGNFLCN